MYVRLGFAVAVNLDPDVLLVDEVLAVGDELFQAKCLSRIKQFQAEGRTIVFVTHDAATVRQVCDRAIVLDHGRLVLDGAPGDAIRTFREHLHGTLADVPDVAHRLDGAGVIGHVEIHHAHLATRRHLLPGEPLDIVVDIAPEQPIDDPVLRVEIGDRAGHRLFAVDSDALGQPLPAITEPQQLRVAIKGIWLLDGRVPGVAPARRPGHRRVIDWREAVATFEVVNEGRAEGTVALDVTIVRDADPSGELRASSYNSPAVSARVPAVGAPATTGEIRTDVTRTGRRRGAHRVAGEDAAEPTTQVAPAAPRHGVAGPAACAVRCARCGDTGSGSCSCSTPSACSGRWC